MKSHLKIVWVHPKVKLQKQKEVKRSSPVGRFYQDTVKVLDLVRKMVPKDYDKRFIDIVINSVDNDFSEAINSRKEVSHG